MIDLLRALLAASIVAGIALVLFWPSFGWVWRWRYLARRSERTLIEDALKHLHECEYRNQRPTVQSVAGALTIRADRSVALVGRMESMGLVTSHGGTLRLADEGRILARHVIRVHRLWERYLSDRTGLSEIDWHLDADRREHGITPAEADALEADLSHPSYDPHGDPIPTATGEIAPRRGRPLTRLTPGTLARIVHLEDEPEASYAQLVAQGLHPGMEVKVIEITSQRVRFWAKGEEHVLSPVAASSVSVVGLPRGREVEASFERLSTLGVGEKGTVVRLSRACHGLERRRLMDLGIVPGTIIEAEMRSPSGDPTAYRVRGALIALRKEQADLIEMTK